MPLLLNAIVTGINGRPAGLAAARLGRLPLIIDARDPGRPVS